MHLALLRTRILFAALAWLGLSLSAAASDTGALESQIGRFVLEQSSGLPGEVNVIVRLPAGTYLPECKEFSLTSPVHARPLGHSSIAVRCPSLPGSWSLLVPVQIQAIAPYLVAARNVPAGQILGLEDLATRTGDLGNMPPGTLTLPEQAVGQVTRTALPAGQPIRPQLLKVVEVVRSGQSVAVLAGGAGFEVRNTGVAQNGGGTGSMIRVRLGNGQVVTGSATARGEVRLAQ